jgi:hypothetical protein
LKMVMFHSYVHVYQRLFDSNFFLHRPHAQNKGTWPIWKKDLTPAYSSNVMFLNMATGSLRCCFLKRSMFNGILHLFLCDG